MSYYTYTNNYYIGHYICTYSCDLFTHLHNVHMFSSVIIIKLPLKCKTLNTKNNIIKFSSSYSYIHVCCDTF